MADIKLQRRLNYTSSYYYEPPKYYTTKAPYYYTTTHAVLSYYTESPQYYSSPSHTTKESSTTLRHRSTAPTRRRSTTQLCILPQLTTPRLPSTTLPRTGVLLTYISWSYQRREGNRNQSIGHLIYDTATTAVSALQTIRHQLHSSSYYQFAIMVNYGVVLLLHVILFMVGSTGMKISPGMTGMKISLGMTSINKNIRNNRLLQRPPSTTPPGLQKNTIIYAAPSYYAECSLLFFP
ncbi:uncharacterized protein LOC124315569 isoform X2 [Daphnia pulicaria]|uniref:uncharacterized protein LOC124315569 isoform X2 n=1 Tax=Daphnia pulicaria TaxID=35523 RepID=UPI001EE9F7B5|nr:uncharacterized protein LOC124315569 isoform X2 [Daphnia pulicaria]